MIKICALNEESSDESDSDEEVTREALEQIALQQYARALELRRRGETTAALKLLHELLDTELLHEALADKPGESLHSLKYLCYKNAASIEVELGDTDAAVRSYCAAADLDCTDVTLWHQLGTLCMRTQRYEMALDAFRRGVERNPRHWPCLDKIVTLLFGLKQYEDCIDTIHDALQLDPGYLRGLVYRKYIYIEYPYIRDYMMHLDSKYKWEENENDFIDETKAVDLLNEAELINKVYMEQLKSEQFKYVLPQLQLLKPITKLEWTSVGESLVHMHNYMTENCFSHACFLNLVYEKENKNEDEEILEQCKKVEVTTSKIEEQNVETEENGENGSENENNELSDKAATDTERVESDLDVPQSDVLTDLNQPQNLETKEPKKTPIRRRGSALSFLEQWEWCNKRRSGRKKPTTKQEKDETIYDTLRRMVPPCLMPNVLKEKERTGDLSPDTLELYKLFDDKEPNEKRDKIEISHYFGTDAEQNDVEQFISKYENNKSDIIEILRDFLMFLTEKWQLKWPENLIKIYLKANMCYSTHTDVPSCIEENKTELIHYVAIKILAEEYHVNTKLQSMSDEKQYHDLNIIENIDLILCSKPHMFGSHCLELMLRQLWVKLHIHIINKHDEFALDCLYRLLHEFNGMGEFCDSYNLTITNFSFKPVITQNEVVTYIKFLERNKQLSTVMDLYEKGDYEEVLSIVIDSFEHCKTIARKQEEEMSLDFAAQLSLILDCLWALDKVEECFKWSLICLHEALEHYNALAVGKADHEKWSLIIVKVLCTMEHILTTEGLTCLELLSQKELSLTLEDLTQIIRHQVESNETDMPFSTVAPWIVMHYILQREDDQGRSRRFSDKGSVASDEIPNPLMVLFIGHEQLGLRGWCNQNDGKLLYFILDTVVPRLRSPSLSRSLEQICQYMEQCVFCLFNHPGKKSKLKYLLDHNVNSHLLNWTRAQQVYEIFRPVNLPEVEGKVPSISVDTEQLFQKILELVPAESDPQKYIVELEKYINGKEPKLPVISPLLPYKMKDIYFLLGDYYFKKEDNKKSIKYNMYDIIVNNDRFESWAEIALAKAVNLELKVNSCYNMDNEKDYFKPVQATMRCFRRALDLDSGHCNLWIEYGVFTYTVHSFCSRLLKQASESLSMEDFDSLEKQKEDMLNITHRCFTTVIQDLNNSHESDKANDEMWLHYYMLGKVAEKQNKSPAIYISHYMNAVKSLQETDAIYPQKINYKSPQRLSFEVLELHYRIHASILKYIEQHENKPIPISVGKIFLDCLEKWQKSPFSKKMRKENTIELEVETRASDSLPQAGNILKRSVSDAGEEDNCEVKRAKLENAAAKIRRSASYDIDLVTAKDSVMQNKMQTITDIDSVKCNSDADITEKYSEMKHIDLDIQKEKQEMKQNSSNHSALKEKKEKNQDSSSETCSSGNSSSESTDSSSSSSSSESSHDIDVSVNDAMQPLSDDKVMEIIAACLDALEDCASRFPQHYKALYRLAHYHFYYKKGKDIERCRDLMLSTFTSRSNQKLGGLFVERKQNNFFNGIWRIPTAEVDRTGGFATHMNRCVLLTMEILKEIDDHKTLLDLSLHLQRTPEPDKKYLRDADREESAQQAFSLCVQSLKGQLTKFSQQADLRSNDVERQALNSLMLDIYRAYQRAQKQPNSKQLVNLLIDAYKLVSTHLISDSNLVDASMKYCQNLIATLKQQATQASLDRSNQNAQKKQGPRADIVKNAVPSTSSTHSKYEQVKTVSAPALSSVQERAASFQNYLSMLNDPLMSQQAAAALSLSYLNNLGTFASYGALQNTLHNSLQSSLQNSYQSEFFRNLLTSNFGSFNFSPTKKQKRSKPSSVNKPPNPIAPVAAAFGTLSQQMKDSSKTFCGVSLGPNIPKTAVSTATLSKSSSAPIAATCTTVSTQPVQAHLANTSATNTGSVLHAKPPPPLPHHSSGKTLQEKLAEKQKHLPVISKSSSTLVQDFNTSINRLPSSLTITKTTGKAPAPPPPPPQTKRLKPTILSDQVIVLDDDD
ncbi:Calcineurin-binding protein cabin-1 [Eumeta japonica]|uniref:Calcineurin-binding protein cabin-1 n=1 Tax=Eumeta variegata TaxID=151549 RepID=A0A4C1TAZ0_EUMVA|nr:Calcineurin-binding protein cabin-1 [Eumeta japonica]